MTSTSRGLGIIFAGTPDFAAAHLQTLIDSPHRILACYTQPDRPAGRGKKLQASPVKQLAEAHGLSVEQPPSLKDLQAQTHLANYNADIMIVVAYGLILPKTVLDAPRLGCINVHASILPRWRGAAPIQRAIEAGDTESGVTIMQMDEGLDTGDMLIISRCPITTADTGGSLHDRLQSLGGPALIEALNQLAENRAQPLPQDDSQSNYAPKISKAEAALDWRQSAQVLDRKIRAFNPFPIAHTARADTAAERLRIWQAAIGPATSAPPGTVTAIKDGQITVACGVGSSLLISVLQLPGKKAMTVAELLRGKPDLFIPGEALELPV